MASFSYRVKQPGHSKVITGQIDAATISDANRLLHEQQYVVLSIEDAAHAKARHLTFSRTKVPLKEKIIFTRQLGVMIRAGLPIVKALQSLQDQTASPAFKKVIGELITNVKGGLTLSKAMARHPVVFPEIYIAVIRAGEETGQLADVLLNLAEQQEKDADLIGKIRSAMIYPIFIMIMLVLMVVLIVYFVLPSLKSVFEQSGATLPLITRILLGASTGLHQYFWYVLVAVIGLYVLLRWWLKRPSGRRLLDHVKLILPVFGSLNKKIYMARFTRTLAMLAKASLPIVSSIKIVRKTINNSLYDASFDRIEQAVENGRPLSAALAKEPLFPPMVSQLTSLGEESASLEAVLLEAANFYDKEVNTTSANLSALIEPLMLVIIGAGVAVVVLAVIGPIYNIASAIK